MPSAEVRSSRKQVRLEPFHRSQIRAGGHANDDVLHQVGHIVPQNAPLGEEAL